MPIHAAELRLNNGDRITGEVVRHERGRIVFRSPILGEISVADTDATIIATPETPVESLTGLPPNEELPAVTKPPLRQIAAIPVKPVKTPQSKWKGKVEFGFINQSGRREALNLSFRAEAELKKAADDYKATARYLYGKTSNLVSSNRRDTNFRWRHDISGRVFFQSLSSYTDDKVAGINLNLEQNGSVGYQFLTTERQKASLGGGVTVQYREASGLDAGLNYLGSLFQDYSYKINGRLTFTQAFNGLYSPDSQARSITTGTKTSNLNTQAENYKMSFNSSLQGKMSERVSLNLRYEYEYDNAMLDPKARTDQRITSSVGYSF